MNTNLDHFRRACGADRPVILKIDRTDGARLTEGELDIPLALIGSDPDCEITLTDPDVALRHAYIQVMDGRVLIVDLNSKAGLHTKEGQRPFAFLSPDAPVRLGPFLLSLKAPVSALPPIPEPAEDPFSHYDQDLVLPRLGIKFLNGKTVRSTWEVSRKMAMIGRAKECKINLTSEDVADFHGYFLLTPMGLYVVDLVSPTGIWVNKEAVRYALIDDGDKIQISRFELECEDLDCPPITLMKADEFDSIDTGQFAVASDVDPKAQTKLNIGNPSRLSPSASSKGTVEEKNPQRPSFVSKTMEEGPPTARLMAVNHSGKPRAAATTAMPNPAPRAPAPPTIATPSPAARIPSPATTAMPNPAPRTIAAPNPPPRPSTAVTTPIPSTATERPPAAPSPVDAVIHPALAPLMQQFGVAQTHMMEQFQQSMMMLMQLFGQMHREQMSVLQKELGRMSELNSELFKLQSQLSFNQAAKGTLPPGAADDKTEVHQWIYEKMNSLQSERQNIWDRLFGLISPKPSPGA